MARDKITPLPMTDPAEPERKGDAPTVALSLAVNARLTDLAGNKAAHDDKGGVLITATLKVDADVSPGADLDGLPLSEAVHAALDFHGNQPEMKRNQGGIWFNLDFRPLAVTFSKGKASATFIGKLTGQQRYAFAKQELRRLRLVINADLTVDQWATLGALLEQDGVSLVIEDRQGSLPLDEPKAAAR